LKRDYQPDLDQVYEREKAAWIAAHPEATPKEYEQAIQEIAARLGY